MKYSGLFVLVLAVFGAIHAEEEAEEGAKKTAKRGALGLLGYGGGYYGHGLYGGYGQGLYGGYAHNYPVVSYAYPVYSKVSYGLGHGGYYGYYPSGYHGYGGYGGFHGGYGW